MVLVPFFDWFGVSISVQNFYFKNLEPPRTGPRTRIESPTQVPTGHILVEGW